MFGDMALDTCNQHSGVKATGRCHACHKPTCPRCRTRDGCCSDRCFQNHQKFATKHVPQSAAPSPLWNLLKFLAIVAIGAGVAKYLKYW